MPLHELTSPGLIYPRLPGADVHTVLRAFALRVEERGLVASADDLYRHLEEREDLGSTAIGAGVAIPHCKLQGLQSVILAIGIHESGVEFGADDGQPVRLFFLIVLPDNEPTAHLQALSAVSKWVKVDDHVQRILQLGDAEAIYQMLMTESD
jgi:PTS system nitrogen regulatory IIA component